MTSAFRFRSALFGAGLAAFAAGPASAAVLLSNSFTAPDGTALAGTSGWTLVLGDSNATAPTINNGVLSMASLVSGNAQRVYGDLGITISSGSVYVGFDFKVTDAPSGNVNIGFLISDLNSPGSSNSSFTLNIAAGATADTFKFGTALSNASASNGTSSVQTADSYSLNTTYRVVVAYNFIEGALNNSARLYVNDSVVASAVYGTTPAEVAGFRYFGLRQPTTANSTAVTFDDLVIATSYNEAATFPASPVPEPASAAAFAAAAVLGLAATRRRRAARV